MDENEKTDRTGEPGKSSASPLLDDADFELSADMMVHDYDDETTLNEEDDEDIETNADELADLTKEGEMPLEDLLALYYGGGPPEKETNESEVNHEDANDEVPRRSLRSASALLNPHLSDSDSSDENEGAVFHEEERKRPRIGDEYQVSVIPDITSAQSEKCEKNDEQVWVPWVLPEDAVEKYLKEIASSSSCKTEPNSATFIQDNEDALFLLRQANNDPEEALRRFKSRPSPLNNELHVWSEQECKQFEDGLTLYGKDFYMIHMNKVTTRSIRDIVKFYYVWKKSERYDHFTAKTRLGKKKELFHSGVTDYMDRLLDETDHGCTSSILGHASGNYLKYCTAAHSAVLMEHLKRLEESGENENQTSQTILDSGDYLQTNNTASVSHNEISANTNNHNSQSLEGCDLGVLSDLVDNSSSVS